MTVFGRQTISKSTFSTFKKGGAKSSTFKKVEPKPLSKFNFLLNTKYQIQYNLIFDNVFFSGFGSTFLKGGKGGKGGKG